MNTCGIQIAVKLDVAAQRNHGKAPARPVPVIEAGKFLAEAEREDVDLYAAPAADQEVAHLVEKHHDSQHEEERHHIAEQRIEVTEDHRWLPEAT